MSQSAEGAAGAFALVPEAAGCNRARLLGGLPLLGTTAGAVLGSGTSASSSDERSMTPSGAVMRLRPDLAISDLLVLAMLAQMRTSPHHGAVCVNADLLSSTEPNYQRRAGGESESEDRVYKGIPLCIGRRTVLNRLLKRRKVTARKARRYAALAQGRHWDISRFQAEL